jgi:acetyl esterase
MRTSVACPRAQFLVGTSDPVRDDSVFMFARWRIAGSPADLVVLPGGLHGLLEWKTPLTRAGRESGIRFLNAVCG